jgi:hypothetical protein
MPSSLTWLDHDPAAKERTNRILSLFRERESRDELGLGSIRDSLSDLLFPGTSTIHTRLRYVLIVPWVYRHLESSFVPASSFSAAVAELERLLIPVLLLGSPGSLGIIGSAAGASVKRLPSSIYWSALGNWGIRLSSASADKYASDVSALYAARREAASMYQRSRENLDDVFFDGFSTWHPYLPLAPSGFPASLGIDMLRSESQFIQERIMATHPSSLLAHLAYSYSGVSSAYPWEYSGSLTSLLSGQLEHARLFSLVMFGASILYNIMLAELFSSRGYGDHGLSSKIELFQSWSASVALEIDVLRSWFSSLDSFWNVISDQPHIVSPATRRFVSLWCSLVVGGGSLLYSDSARELVRSREILKKGSNRSRFMNMAALRQWGGASGMYRMDFRWGIVKVLLSDLFAGLENNASS